MSQYRPATAKERGRIEFMAYLAARDEHTPSPISMADFEALMEHLVASKVADSYTSALMLEPGTLEYQIVAVDADVGARRVIHAAVAHVEARRAAGVRIIPTLIFDRETAAQILITEDD